MLSKCLLSFPVTVLQIRLCPILHSEQAGRGTSIITFVLILHSWLYFVSLGMWAHLPRKGCGGQRTTDRNQVSLSTTRVPGIKLGLPVLWQVPLPLCY